VRPWVITIWLAVETITRLTPRLMAQTWIIHRWDSRPIQRPDSSAEALRRASEWRIFTRVVFPLARLLMVMTLMYRWNEFAWPLVVL